MCVCVCVCVCACVGTGARVCVCVCVCVWSEPYIRFPRIVRIGVWHKLGRSFNPRHGSVRTGQTSHTHTQHHTHFFPFP